ncbi:MAG: hypothetical protein OXI91_12855 [Chloroflexota bacterium]|nr:hypothetical protein [Chloroflexota bacterium]
MYQRIGDFSFFVLTAILIANLLTAVAIWYEIYYVASDSTTETIKAIYLDAAAATAVAIWIVGTIEAVMVLHKLILEKYLANRFNEGEARGLERGRREGREEGVDTGREQAYDEWGAWYGRMLEARERGEDFEEPPPQAFRGQAGE